MIKTPVINSGHYLLYLIQLMSINQFLEGSIHLTMDGAVTLENNGPSLLILPMEHLNHYELILHS